jgi:hypothetical protein
MRYSVIGMLAAAAWSAMNAASADQRLSVR